MKLENGKLVLEKKNCYCQDGTEARPIPCPTCKGTGNGKRGGRGGCRKCNGSGREWDQVNRITCKRCNGNFANFEDEDTTDSLPPGIWENLEFKVFRSNRPMTLNESLIGIGYVFTCTDYGRWKGLTDEKLIEDVKDHKSLQACKVAQDDGTMCKYIAIECKDQGYTVKAIF